MTFSYILKFFNFFLIVYEKFAFLVIVQEEKIFLS